MTDAELSALFDPAWHFKHVDTIFARVFGEAEAASTRPKAARETAPA
jgi:hypothetical protein